jgi:hypothetical protein
MMVLSAITGGMASAVGVAALPAPAQAVSTRLPSISEISNLGFMIRSLRKYSESNHTVFDENSPYLRGSFSLAEWIVCPNSEAPSVFMTIGRGLERKNSVKYW